MDGCAERLREDPQRETVERVADQILRNIDRSDRMIRDLLDVHRVRAGKRFHIEIEPYLMSDLVDEITNDMRLAHGDRFIVDTQKDVYGFWSWDGMRRAIENLVSNAVKYGAPGTPITIRVRRTDGEMELSVHNEGRTLSKEEQARIFEPFERGSTASIGRVSGWGIGLTLAKSLISAHGGRLAVDSTPGRGTTFTIHNPMDSRPYAQQSNDE